MAVPLNVEHGRQRVAVRRHVQHEPQRLLMRRPAPIDEMIGAARDAGPLGGVPIVEELGIEMVAALGRLDEGELHAGVTGFLPIDVTLPVGHVDALDRHGVSGRHAVMRLGVLQGERERGAATCRADNGERHGQDRKLAIELRHESPPVLGPLGSSLAPRRLEFSCPALHSNPSLHTGKPPEAADHIFCRALTPCQANASM
jgi:hypothetical protein